MKKKSQDFYVFAQSFADPHNTEKVIVRGKFEKQI